MTRDHIPRLIIMPIAYLIAIALIPFALIALAWEWGVYKFRSIK